MKNNNRILMKIGRSLMVLLFLGGVLASCSKDKNNDDSGVNQTDFSQAYFNIQHGEWSGRALPTTNSSTLEILEITGNSTVLAGGSNIIHVTASENASHVIIGVQGQEGYFTLPLVLDDSGSGRGVNSRSMETNLSLLIGQRAEGNFKVAFTATDGQENYGPYEYLEVNLRAAGTGILQVNLSWDKLNDVDLHVIEPNGEHIYYGHRNSVNGGQLDIDSNAGCSINDPVINAENIYYADSEEVTIEYGEYEVLVDLWSHCLIDQDTNYTIIVYYGGHVIATTAGVNPHEGILTVADESHNSNLISVMKFVIDGAPAGRGIGNSNALTLPTLYEFKHDKSNKVFKNFSPIKG